MEPSANGKRRYSGGQDLKDTQAYPYMYGEAVREAFDSKHTFTEGVRFLINIPTVDPDDVIDWTNWIATIRARGDLWSLANLEGVAELAAVPSDRPLM